MYLINSLAQENMNKRVQDVMDRMDEFYPLQPLLDKMNEIGETDLIFHIMREVQSSYIKDI